MKRRVSMVAIVVILAVLAGCAPGGNEFVGTSGGDESEAPAGFWLGLWHGFITPVTFVVSLFHNDVNVYEVFNNGGWYNLGFVLGASIIFGGSGGGAAGHRRRKKRRDDEEDL